MAVQARMPGQASKPRLDVKQWLEQVAIGPVLVGVVLSLVVRSAQVWSFQTFRLAALPGVVQSSIDVATGFCVALGLELVMAAAGAQWWRARREAFALEDDNTLAKKRREARVARVRREARIHFWAMLGGALASLGGSLYFGVTATHDASWAALTVDLLVGFGIVFMVFYFTVAYEPARPDTARVAVAAVEEELHASAGAVLERFRAGIYNGGDIAFLRTLVSGPTARKLETIAAATAPEALEAAHYYTTRAIMEALGLSGESAARDVRRRLRAALEEQPALGVRPVKRGRGLECPDTAFMALFADYVARNAQRTATDAAGALVAGLAAIGASGDGQRTDN